MYICIIMNNTVIDTRYVLVTPDDSKYVKSHGVFEEYTSDINKAKAFVKMETAQKHADEINHKNTTYGYKDRVRVVRIDLTVVISEINSKQ